MKYDPCEQYTKILKIDNSQRKQNILRVKNDEKKNLYSFNYFIFCIK